jgi:5-methylthioadenosine/S-adenosylhomocysteine deaminase
MAQRTLIRGGCVLTLAARSPNYTEADVLIDGDRIAEVGQGLRARDAELVDATDTIVMPGFVDAHRHVWESLFRNLGGAVAASPSTYGPHFGPDDVYAATLVGLLGALEAGITTIVDWFEAGTDPVYADAALQAHADSGIRSVFAFAAPSWADGDTGWAAGLRRLADSDRGPRLTVAAGSREPGRASLDGVAGDWALARELGLRIHAHAGTDVSEGGAVTDLGARGDLGSDVTLIHCTHLSDTDLDAVASSGAAVAIAPSEEMAGGLGAPPVQKLIDRQIRPGLGVGTEGFAPGDLFAQMRAVISIQHASYFDLKLAGKAGLPNLLNTREMIRYSTVYGAGVAGLGDTVGTLEPGRQADIVVLRTDRPNIWPVNDPIGAVVWGMDTSNVDWVFVAGEALMRDGALVGDVERARDLASTAQRRVGGASGLLTGAGREGAG